MRGVILESFFDLPYLPWEEARKGAIDQNTIVLIGSTVVTQSMHSSKGMEKSANIIREASQELTGYLPERDIDIHFENIIDVGNFGREELGTVVQFTLDRGGVPIVIGGDHATTYFSLRNSNLSSILWLDAHTDLAKEGEIPNAEKESHGSALLLLSKNGKTAHVVGFRGYSSIKQELKRARELGIQVHSSPFKHETLSKLLTTIPAISLDLDFFSAVEFPAVRNPEIRGSEVSTFIHTLRESSPFRPKYIDIVEYLPSRDSGSYAIILSQLILEILTMLVSA